MSRVGRSVSKLVDVQVLRYKDQERKSVRPDATRRHSLHPSDRQAVGSVPKLDEWPQPMITVSREFGAAGGEIACLVAGKLGYAFFGQELVHEIARRAQVKRVHVETVDERCRDRLEGFVADLIDRGAFRPDDYLKNLTQVVHGIGNRGRGVIVGRAGHLLLRPEATLRVRVIGPFAARAERVAARERMTEAEAREKVLRVDAERMAFYRHAFRVDISNPLQFDLVINTGRVSIGEAAELIIAAHARRFAEPTPVPESSVRCAVPESPSALQDRVRRSG